MTTKKGLVHAIFQCGDCDWREEDYLTAQQKARKHHEKTGHHVCGDVGYYVEYGP